MPNQERIVVGVKLRPDSLELLQWVISTTARPGDQIIALHFLDQSAIVGKGEEEGEKLKSETKAALLWLLEPFQELCCTRQVKARVHIAAGESLEKVLVEAATALHATSLVLSTKSSRSVAPWRQALGSYCSRHCPTGCAVLVVTNKKMLLHKENLIKASISSNEILPCEETQEVHKRCGPASRSLCTLQKHFLCSVRPKEEDTGTIEEVMVCLHNQAVGDTADMPSAVVGNWQKGDLTEGGSPRGVLEGLGSLTESERSSPTSTSYPEDPNVWSLSTSRKGLLGSPSSRESDGLSVASEPQQRHGIQSLWKAFATKRWKSLPSSYRHNKQPVMAAPSPATLGSADELSPDKQDDASALICADSSNGRRSWRTFSYEEISAATSNFDPENLVGKGGYAKVFKGVLPSGQLIAVKKHNRGDTAEQKERDFLVELGIIGHVCHPNAAALVGICIENGLHLIFEFSQHGSLAALLHCPKAPVLEWGVRFKVALGVARGLQYLHEHCQRRIIHRDIKASNILLGPDFEPQISDFGLAKWLPSRWTHHTVSPIEGTFGYLAPEYFMHGIVDEKTDVFSYGVLLLELITGRRPVADKQNLVMWAKPMLESEDIKELADRRLGSAYDASQMQRMVLTATLCVRQSAVWRPCMSQVVQLLTEESSDVGKTDHLSKLVSKSSEFDQGEQYSQEDYSSDTYLSDMQRHRALALEF